MHSRIGCSASYARPVVSPAAEIELSELQVRSLLHSQRPDLEGLSITRLDQGWDNMLWRLGEEFLIRVPRRQVAARLILNEQIWLPRLAPRLPLPVPMPIRLGRPSVAFPWPWSVLRWIDGCAADQCAVSRLSTSARVLARFLKALHLPAPPDAPHNPVRGVPIRERPTSFEEGMPRRSAGVDAQATRRVWERACAAPP